MLEVYTYNGVYYVYIVLVHATRLCFRKIESKQTTTHVKYSSVNA